VVFGLDAEVIAVIGIFLGALVRVLLPYIRKAHAGELDKFEPKYLVEMVAGMMIALVVTMMLIPQALLNSGLSFLQLLSANFIIGIGSTELIHEIIELRG